jgi:dihydropteroate synthase
MSHHNTTLRIGTRVFDLSKQPLVMGILNVTPDSFYKGSRINADHVADIASTMVADGATILDVGGYSTRPGAIEVSLQEELDRVLPSIAAIRSRLPSVLISIDTFRKAVASAAIEVGANLINDVSGGHADDQMIPFVGQTKTPYILMHSRGTPVTMQSLAKYDNVTYEVMQELRTTLAQLHALGHYEIIIDPGFGFAKTVGQNYELLRHLLDLQLLGCPILAGLSRKSMAWRPLGITADEALNSTTALNMLALQNGAHLLRVHDVRPAAEAIKVWQLYHNQLPISQ